MLLLTADKFLSSGLFNKMPTRKVAKCNHLGKRLQDESSRIDQTEAVRVARAVKQ